MSNTGSEAVKLDPCCSWEGHSKGVGAGVRDEMRSLVGLSARSVFHYRPIIKYCSKIMMKY